MGKQQLTPQWVEVAEERLGTVGRRVMQEPRMPG
jgi:hypothetical protein